MHPDAADRNIRGQYTKLIAEPLKDLLGVKGKLILVVIDALDGCEPHDAVGRLTLFASEVHKMPRLKLFITTRPERYIRNILARNRGHVYTQKIRSAVPNPVDDWVDHYQEIVGTVLAGLLDIDVDDIHGTLSHLHSFIAVERTKFFGYTTKLFQISSLIQSAAKRVPNFSLYQVHTIRESLNAV